jgi:hypothetical protein
MAFGWKSTCVTPKCHLGRRDALFMLEGAKNMIGLSLQQRGIFSDSLRQPSGFTHGSAAQNRK